MAEEEQKSENLEETDYDFDTEEGQSGPYQDKDRDKDYDFGEEEYAGEEDLFSKIGSSSDDPEQQRRYLEYLGLLKEIDCQNAIVERLKNEIIELCAKKCKTRCEMKEIQEMRQCLEQENLKLCCLVTKAMELQNFGSHRRYRDIPVATTFEEDNMTPYVNCVKPKQPSTTTTSESSEEKSNTSPSQSFDEDKMRCLCQALKSMKICCPEDKKLVQQVAAILCKDAKSKPKSKGPCDPCRSKPQPCDPCRPPCPVHKKPPRISVAKEEDIGEGGPSPLDKLKQKICCMQKTIQKLKEEISRREKEIQGDEQEDTQKPKFVCEEEEDPLTVCAPKRDSKADQLKKLKESYVYLLTEFSKKDSQIKDLEKRLKGFCGGCGNMGKSQDDMQEAAESEVQLLRARVNELKEEQTEFKCLMREQSQQLEDYRSKYLVAQQKVEEQAVTLEKLNLNNRRIEKQINTEVKEIRAKFQEKLNELLHFPKLLENEQLKLAECCKEKEELQGKLVLVCKELQATKQQMSNEMKDDCRPRLIKCELELSEVKRLLEETERQRDLYCNELTTMKDDLDTLRSESAKIIARTKERAELTRQKMQDHIDQLEKQLAQCRASACLHVNDREAVIREMQGQLNSLSYSFDAAQKQIKTLRNHIAYVSNENCYPVKC